jgi:hypothetical protein
MLVRISPGWLQSWLQLAAFVPIRLCPLMLERAGQTAYGTTVNRPERDHDA